MTGNETRRHVRYAWVGFVACVILALGLANGLRTRPKAPPAPDRPQVACAAVLPAGLNIELRDSLTGAGISDSVTVLVSERGARVDSVVSVIGPGELPPYIGAAYGRAGRFHVRVSRPGYVDWQRDDVVVAREAVCNQVVPVALVARLQRAR